MRPKRGNSSSASSAEGAANSARRVLARTAIRSPDFFEALAETPLPAQLSLLRRMLGVSQANLASELKMKQAYLSRLEAGGTSHNLNHYLKVAKALGARLVVLPRSARVIWQRPVRLRAD